VRNGRDAHLIFDPKHHNAREVAPGQRLRDRDYLDAPRNRLVYCRRTGSVLHRIFHDVGRGGGGEPGPTLPRDPGLGRPTGAAGRNEEVR
jgi:hypothetical protein